MPAPVRLPSSRLPTHHVPIQAVTTGARARQRAQCRWRADRRGTTALEFALIAPAFFLLLFGATELAYDLFAQATLDGALQTAVRNLQTGQWQSNASTPQQFHDNYVCPALRGLLPCSAVTVNIRVVNPNASSGDYSTNSLSWTLPVDSQGRLSLSGFNVCPGSPQQPGASLQLMQAQAVFTGWTILGQMLSFWPTSNTLNGRVHVTMSSMAFINENYQISATMTYPTSGGGTAC
jgi:Flp pilus assembly protein TadG